MSDGSDNPPDGRRPASRLPADPAYWDGLAARVSDRAAPLVARYGAAGVAGGAGGSGWLGWLEGRASRLAAAALAAAVLAWLFLPPPAPPASSAPQSEIALARALEPSDPLIAGIMADAGPPVLARLIVPTEDPRP